jgi:hypothetical protein
MRRTQLKLDYVYMWNPPPGADILHADFYQYKASSGEWMYPDGTKHQLKPGAKLRCIDTNDAWKNYPIFERVSSYAAGGKIMMQNCRYIELARYTETKSSHTNNDEESNVTTATKSVEKKTSTVDIIKNATTKGVKVSASVNVANALVTKIQQLLGEKYPAVLTTELGRKVAPGLLATSVLFLANGQLAHIDHAAKASSVCEFVLEGVARDVSDDVLSIVQDVAPALFASLAAEAPKLTS